MQKEFNQQLFESTFNKHKALLKTRLNEFNRHPDDDDFGDGYSNDSQRAYALSQMETPRKNERKKAEELAKSGKYVIINTHPIYCKSTDAVLGDATVIEKVYDNEEEAKEALEKLETSYPGDNQYGFITPETVNQKRQSPSTPSDDVPFEEDYNPDERERHDWERKISKYNKANKQRYECPTCKTPNALSAWEKQQGYQCNQCADNEEGTGGMYESEYKKHFKYLLKEALTPKGIETVKKWCEKFGNREAGIKIIDNILSKRIGLTSADLPDTSTFANGLDAIEDELNAGNYQGAFEQAKETATEMLQDEGMDVMDEVKEPKADMVSNSDRNKIRKSLQQQGLNGNVEFVDKSNGILAIRRALDTLGFDLDEVSGNSILGDKGFKLLPYRRTSADGVSAQPEIKNSSIVFNWDKPGGDTYEIQCYAS